MSPLVTIYIKSKQNVKYLYKIIAHMQHAIRKNLLKIIKKIKTIIEV
jgi:hypothetical protein